MLLRNTQVVVFLTLLLVATPARSQVVLSGRVRQAIATGAAEQKPVAKLLCFAQRDGDANEAIPFRTWETEPAGWYRLAGAPGRYALLLATPSHFARPFLRTNLFAESGDDLDLDWTLDYDAQSFGERDYDHDKAAGYYQPFTARSRSITHVGFKLAHDGVDGVGPGSQTFLISIHRVTGEPATKWPQVGPTGVAVEVDCGGPKSYHYSVGWNSGEVPVEPGQRYAVYLRPESATATCQTFWSESDADSACQRVAPNGEVTTTGRRLWFSIAGDHDGLLIPYNKHVHREFIALTKSSKTWSQTYVAQGRGLAGVVLYAAVSGAQPPLTRQRVRVTVHRGGVDGEPVGISKIAIGNGNYTGDASWGAFGCVFAPGEVPLTPGEAYAIEWTSIETLETLHGFVNIKGEVSNDRPGFNPYRKHPLDEYAQGSAWLDGNDQGFDLDAQFIEYENDAPDWSVATTGANLLQNGDLQAAQDAAPSWTPYTVTGAPLHQQLPDQAEPANQFLRIASPPEDSAPCEGGYVQRVAGLTAQECYRLALRVRSTHPFDDRHACLVGIDPTGQMDDPHATTIRWTSLSELHGVWVVHTCEPVRPREQSISIWLAGRATAEKAWPFHADFDDVTLHRVDTGVPH